MKQILTIGLVFVSAMIVLVVAPSAVAGTPTSDQQRAYAPQGTMSTVYRSDPPTYAVHLVDSRTAIVWLDAQSDAAQPRWVCEVPAKRDGSEGRREILTAASTNWRAALTEAVSLLGGLVADGE
jgi:hypothetical protein